MSRSKTTNNENASTPPKHARGFWVNTKHYIQEEWRAAVFVAACVTLLHLWFHWLDAIESYAFLVVGNLVAAVTAEPTPNPNAVVVVRIDEPTFITRYRERSPLDRCILSSQLSAIYAAKPHTVVIDLDLSPTDWSQREKGPTAQRERYCQALLEATLAPSVEEGCPRQDLRGVRTAVMEPFHSRDPEVAARVAKWRDKQECAGVRFGDAALPVNYGMTLEYFTGDHTLYAAAMRDTVARRAGDATARSNKQRKIDTKAYARNLKTVHTSWTDTPVAGTADYTDADLTEILRRWLPPEAPGGTRNRIVFFGAGYGQDDTFLTPVGMLYGVEVHAAAFTSPPRVMQIHHALELVVDLIFALIFGRVIVGCWNRYFAWRCNDRSWQAQLAWVWVAIMLVSLLGMIAVTLWVSYLLLRFGLWLSPVAIALGMLIESCMAGSVEAAARRLKPIEPAIEWSVPAAPRAIKWATGFNEGVWIFVVVAAAVLVFH